MNNLRRPDYAAVCVCHAVGGDKCEYFEVGWDCGHECIVYDGKGWWSRNPRKLSAVPSAKVITMEEALERIREE